MPEEIEVPTEHLHEKMEEAAESGARWISRVAVSSAILAVLAAICALYAGHHANEAILEEMEATDQWALYQAKGIKKEVLSSRDQLLKTLDKAVPAEDETRLKQYETDLESTKDKAEGIERSSTEHMSHHVNYARGVTAFQIAIALGAIAVLARKPQLWFVSLGAGAIGLLFMIFGIL